MELDEKSSVGAAITAGLNLGKEQTNPLADGRPFVLVPEGTELEYLEEVIAQPPRAKGTVKLRDVASFVAAVNRWQTDETLVYGLLEPASFLAVFNDMRDSDKADAGAWRDFRATFIVPPSREWTVWNAANHKQMGQVGFAEFIEDNLPDIITPTGSDMLTLALNFEAAKSGRFVSSTRLKDGASELIWKEDIEQGKANKLELPDLVTLNIPVFENSEPRELQARLKFRVKDGGLAIWYELVRPHKVLEAAFREVWARIETDTALKPLLGTPE
jgi:uncharacterized protein YfdQ (DUF2303 family)